MCETNIEVGDKVRYSSWETEDVEYANLKVDKILRDEETEVRYAYLVPTSENPDTRLIEFSVLQKEYEVIEDE